MSIVYRAIIIILVLVLLFGITLSSLNLTKRRYRTLVHAGLEQSIDDEEALIREEDLSHLPLQIKRYLTYVGVLDTPKVHNFELRLSGEMKMDKDRDFSPYQAKQTSFIDQGIRLFYMDLWLNKLKISGLHHFNDENARMKIKVLDIFTVVDESGEMMQKAETVTFFNDMVVFAPQTLISDKINWEVIDDKRVKATFTHNEITITATLYFDDEGKLVNFVSNDRLALEDTSVSNTVPWSTPITNYKTFNGLNLPQYGKAIWHYEEGEFTYITLNVDAISYNVSLSS